MPNWCENNLTVQGKLEDIISFVNQHIGADGEFNFETIMPYPTKLTCPQEYICEDVAEQHLCNLNDDDNMSWFDWYGWCRRFWGTKWNASNTQCPSIETIKADNLTAISIWFDTAWTPALPIIFKLQKLHPELEITCTYDELGMWFGGEVLADGTEREFNEDEMRERFSYALDEEEEEK